MGGKKRLSLKQMERTQAREQQQTKTGSSKSTGSAKSLGIFLPNQKSKEVIAQLKKLGVLTPFTVASQFDIRLSTAKDFLKLLEKQGMIEYVSGDRNLSIYRIAS